MQLLPRNLQNLASPSKIMMNIPQDANIITVKKSRKNTSRDVNDAGSEESANFYTNRSNDKMHKIDVGDSPERNAKQSSILEKIKECLEMADEVQKINIKLREENKEISDLYEKEKAKVFQLNFEMEHKKASFCILIIE